MPKSAVTPPVQTRTSFSAFAQVESTPKKTVKVTEPLGAGAQGTSGTIGERPGPARRPTHLTIGAIKESEGIGLLEELTINDECNVVEEAPEDSTSIPGIHAEIQNDVPQRALTSRDSGNMPAACVQPTIASDEPRLSRRERRMSYTGCGCGCSKGSVARDDTTATATTSSLSPGIGPVKLGLLSTRLPRCWPSSVGDIGKIRLLG